MSDKITIRVLVWEPGQPCPTPHVVENVPDTRPGARPGTFRSQPVTCPTCGK